MTSLIRQRAGAILYDVPRFLWGIRPRLFSGGETAPWVFVRNRNERILFSKVFPGVCCDWRWTSDLYLPKVFPWTGQILMNKALNDWPISFQSEPNEVNDIIDVSFIIGHRGRPRLPHLLATLQSIAGQQEISFECIVVEQAQKNEAQDALPKWVRYLHTVLPDPNMPYSRAWAFNVGARHARGKLLVFHDGDILIPARYGFELLKRQGSDFDIVNIKRFIFYLSEIHTTRLLETKVLQSDFCPIQVMENAEAGGSIAIRTQTFFDLGGFDEEFIGWGGEDNEFWERAETRRVFKFGYIPLVHLWHPPQPDARKISGMGKKTAALVETRSAISPQARISELRKRKFGNVLNPDPCYTPMQIRLLQRD